ncbi:MAG: HlyD family secretion protein [Pseudomonadota bacterium]|nr:HlyD family secretion protein [Pseudomonadota bacterium]
MSPLFRDKAVTYASVRHYGKVVLATPMGYGFLTLLFTAIAAGLVAFFWLCNYQRKVQVTGVLLPEAGVIRVVSSQGGVVVERTARDGQAVKAGDTLFVLTNERPNAGGGDAEKIISALLQGRRDSLFTERNQMQQQSAQRMDAATRSANDLAKDITHIDAQRVLQQRRVTLTEESLQRLTDLRAQGFVSAAQVQDKQGELLDQRQRLSELERTAAAAARDLAKVRADSRDQLIQAQRDQEGASRSIATLEQDLTESEARRQIVVRAPQDGVITAINAELGQTVTASQTLVSLLPKDTPLIAELYAPSRAAGFVKPGMDVLIRYPAYPYQKFGQHAGRVKEVSSTAMRPEELPLLRPLAAPGNAGEPLYRVRVALDRQAVTTYGNQQPLKSGMALDASILLEKRRLYEWVLEPLYTVTGRL